jgi:hypothetical protein
MQLLAHPDAPGGAVRNLEAHAEWGADGRLRLSWRLDADLAGLRLPAAAAPARADELWRHTCFEAFVAPLVGGAQAPISGSYCELNFSPSGEWAAYRFSGYRSGMAALDLTAPPAARWRRRAQELTLEVALRAQDLLPGAATDALRIGLSAVIEDRSGTISYWALCHQDGKPDFHHADSFALELAAPDPTSAREARHGNQQHDPQ